MFDQGSRTGKNNVAGEIRLSVALASFLQGSRVWIIEYEEFISGEWQRFASIRPRNTGDAVDVNDVAMAHKLCAGPVFK